MNILFIANTVPYPLISGDRVRTYNLLQRVAEKHTVYLACHLYNDFEWDGVAHLETLCEAVLVGPIELRSKLAHLPGLLRYAGKGWPLELKFYQSETLADQIRELAATVTFDVVQLEESMLMLYQELIPPNKTTKRIVTFQNISYTQMDRMKDVSSSLLGRIRNEIYSHQMRSWEPSYAGKFDHCIMMSELEQQEISRANPSLSVSVIPNGVDTHYNQPLPPAEDSHRIMFVGNMEYQPCVDAMLYFTGAILPRIQQAIPDVVLFIVGSNPVPAIKALASDCITVTGRVPDVRLYYEQSAISIVPLRAGGGTRLKILESMALGRPLVSTSIGCEGLNVTHEENILVADDAEQFAAQCIRLLSDQALAERLCAAARQHVVAHYNWDDIARRLLQLYDPPAHPQEAHTHAK